MGVSMRCEQERRGCSNGKVIFFIFPVAQIPPTYYMSPSPSHIKPIMMFPSKILDDQHFQAGAGGGGGREHPGEQCRDHGEVLKVVFSLDCLS